MKTLELEGFGLVEMKHDELINTDGGGFFGALIGAVVGVIAYYYDSGEVNGDPATLTASVLLFAYLGYEMIPI